MERRFENILQGRAQSRVFMSQNMLDKLERMMKRVVGRQIDQRVLTELAKFKLDFTNLDTSIPSIVLSSPNVKVTSFMKKVDSGASDVLTLGIEASQNNAWADCFLITKIFYKADNVTPDNLTVSFVPIESVTIYYNNIALTVNVQVIPL